MTSAKNDLRCGDRDETQAGGNVHGVGSAGGLGHLQGQERLRGGVCRGVLVSINTRGG